MAIKLSDLEQPVYGTRVIKSLHEARAQSVQTAFLCHSHEDRRYVENLQGFLDRQGWHLYVDWQDGSLPSSPNAETATKIKRKIGELDWFLFLATPSSVGSRWCPWEIGIADGIKHRDRLVVIPTVDRSGRYHGNEYLQIYKHVYSTTVGLYALFKPGDNQGILLNHVS